MQLVFQFCTEVGALQAFGQEVALQCVVLEVLPDIGEPLLPVLQNLDDIKQDPFHIAVLFRSVE